MDSVSSKRRIHDNMETQSRNTNPSTTDDDDGIADKSTKIVDDRPIKIQRLRQDDIYAFEEEHKSNTLNIYEYHETSGATTTTTTTTAGRNPNQLNSTNQHWTALQLLIHNFCQRVTPYTYDLDNSCNDTEASTLAIATTIDQFAQQCTELILLTTVVHDSSTNHDVNTTDDDDDDAAAGMFMMMMPLLHQLHGILFLWLSYIVTSHIPWDVTNTDCLRMKTKLLTTTHSIGTCLLEIYRRTTTTTTSSSSSSRSTSSSSTVPQLASIESFMILFRTLIFLTKPMDRSNTLPPVDDSANLETLFEVIHYTIHHVHQVLNEMSTYEFQQFLLCYVRTASTTTDTIDSITTCTSIKSTLGPANYNRTRQTLEHIRRLVLESSDTELFASLVDVAMNEISITNSCLILTSTTRIDNNNKEEKKMSVMQLFRIQCVLQLLHNKQQQGVAVVAAISEIVEYLERICISISTYPDEYPISEQLLVLDCMVTITSFPSPSSSCTIDSGDDELVPYVQMYGLVTEIFIYFLLLPEYNRNKPTMTSSTYLLKCKAVEGLQHLMAVSDDENNTFTIFDCIIKNENRYLNSNNYRDHPKLLQQQLTTSLFNICTEYHTTQYGIMYPNQSDAEDVNYLWNYVAEDSVLGAAEVLLALLSFGIESFRDTSSCPSSLFFLPVPYVMDMCIQLLQYFSDSSSLSTTSYTGTSSTTPIRYDKRNQHIQYLLIHLLDENIETLSSYIVSHGVGLLSAMANVVLVTIDDITHGDNNDPQTIVTIQQTILRIYRYLLFNIVDTNSNNPSIMFQSLLGRDCKVLQAITAVVVLWNNNTDHHHYFTSPEEINSMVNTYPHELAIDILCLLSDDVYNRRIMVRQSHLLPCMIRYLHSMEQQQEQQMTDSTNTATTTTAGSQRDRIKQCIQQLASVL